MANRMIEIKVSGLIQSKIDAVDDLLKNYSSYNDWWLIPTETIDGKEKYFQFTPLPFVKIGLEEDFYHANRELRFRYVKGPFRGTGIWELEKIDGETQISYTIRLKPVNFLIGLMAKTPFFKWKHSQDIRNIIKEIEKKVTEN